MTQPRLELLYFQGCPNHHATLAFVERIAAELGLEPTVDLVEVSDARGAVELRFLGSPTVRINGHDVEPGADERRDFGLSCRVYRGERGTTGLPDEKWIRKALAQAAR